MVTLGLQKKANVLPSNTMEWGSNIIAQAVDRLTELRDFIQEYRTIQTDSSGNGVGIIILQGAKAFIPVVIKEWDVQPMDTVVYRKQNETRYAYLSKRTLLNLLVTSSLGTPAGDPRRTGVFDAFVNVFSPAGGYTYSSNPLYGATRTKLGSDYALENLQKQAFWKGVSDNVKLLAPEKSASIVPPYMVIEKQAGMGMIPDEYKAYFFGAEEGVPITEEQVQAAFDTVKDPIERMEKVALLNDDDRYYALLGNLFPVRDNVYLKHKEDHVLADRSAPTVPAKPAVVIYQGEPTYINPQVMHFDGSPSTYSLGVQIGGFCLKKEFINFTANNGPNSSNVSKDELMGQVSTNDMRIGSIYTLYHRHKQETTVPFKLLEVHRDQNNYITLKVRPLIGPNTTNTIILSRVDSPQRIADGFTYLYPFVETEIRSLPKYVEYFRSRFDDDRTPPIEVIIKKRGGELYQIDEKVNGKMYMRGPFTRGKLYFELVSRYGFDCDQANHVIARLYGYKSFMFSVRNILTEMCDSPKINTGEIFPIEKEAIDGAIKIASQLYKMANISPETYRDGLALDQLMSTYYDSFQDLRNSSSSREAIASGIDFLRKVASQVQKVAQAPEVEQSQAPANAENRANFNSTRMGAQYAPMGQNGNLLGFLMNAGSTEKNTRQVIDELSFYSAGRLRPEEGSRMAKELFDSLNEVENLLAKTLMLLQLSKIPGFNYSDVKLLISDIDSFLSLLKSSIVMQEGRNA